MPSVRMSRGRVAAGLRVRASYGVSTRKKRGGLLWQCCKSR